MAGSWSGSQCWADSEVGWAGHRWPRQAHRDRAGRVLVGSRTDARVSKNQPGQEGQMAGWGQGKSIRLKKPLLKSKFWQGSFKNPLKSASLKSKSTAQVKSTHSKSKVKKPPESQKAKDRRALKEPPRLRMQLFLCLVSPQSLPADRRPFAQSNVPLQSMVRDLLPCDSRVSLGYSLFGAPLPLLPSLPM